MAARPSHSDSRFLAVLAGKRVDPPPIWLMRQAGRYLPEYRSIRERAGSFLGLVYDEAAAAEVTLQPIRRFGFDAAILFSDILIVPHALGQELRFEAGEGPRLSPPLAEVDLGRLEPRFQRFEAVARTVSRVAAALPPGTALIGFAGSPWTVATYMVNGAGSRDHARARSLAYREPERFGAIIRRIEAATIDYLCRQIAAGALALQLFDSWSGALAPDQFDRWVIEPTRRIVEGVRARYPHVPVIGFPKGAGGKLVDYVERTGVDAVGLDETVDPAWADRVLPRGLPVQGNLDPLALIAGGTAMRRQAAAILRAFSGRPHIFNLGHGILPETPIAHVEALLDLVRSGP